MLQFTQSPENDFSSGIDARSAENQIQPGFVADLLNANIIQTRARRRSGYQGYAGNLPIRAVAMQYKDATNEVCFSLDSAVSLDSTVDLGSVRSSPLVIYGRSSVFTPGQGPFDNSTDHVKYYPKFHIPTRKQFVAPSGVLSVPGDEHGLGTTNLLVGLSESTSVVDRSHSIVDSDKITVDESSFDIDVTYTTAVNRNVYIYFADNSPIPGSTYVQAELAVTPGTHTYTIPAATHALSNFDIVPQFQQDTGAVREYIEPDSFLILPNGDVQVTYTNGTAGNIDLYILLAAAPISNTQTGVVGANSSGTITLSGLTKPWIFPAIYLEQTPGGTKELVLPDSMDYNDATQQMTLSFTNQANVARNFIIFYKYGDMRSNQICVDDASVTFSGNDPAPQISIWGLEHTEIYTTKSHREAWVNLVDSYKRPDEQRLVSGLGGNLFDARTYAESATQYAYPLVYTNLQSRSSANAILGPVFWDSGEAPALTRGYITGDSQGTHWASVSSVSYNSGTGYTDYVLSVPSKLILDSTGTPTSLSSVINTTAGLRDKLTVQGMGWSLQSGTFEIRAVTDGSNQITVSVDNSANSADYNDPNCGGLAGIFTDRETWVSASPYVPGDQLISDALPDPSAISVVSSLGSTSVLSGLADRLQIPGGVEFSGQRTSSVIATRSANPGSAPSVLDIVRGDMLSYVGIDRLLRVQYVNSDSDRSINITATGGTATATLGSGDTSYLTPGHEILLTQAGVYSGAVLVDNVLSDTQFTFSSTSTDTVVGATLLGKTIQVDEELSWMDSSADTEFLLAPTRWIPIEAPDDSFNLTPNTHVRYFDSNVYSAQPFIRSTTVVDNMYINDYDDEAYKFDGASNYRAGLFSWQPGLFLTQETTGAAIVADLRSITTTAVDLAAGKATIAIANNLAIPVGTQVRFSGSELTYTIRDYADPADGVNAYLLTDRALDSNVVAGTVSEIGVWRYYFRLNAVDANDNAIASAVTGSQDYVVELTQNAAVQLKLVGMPAWDVYDYSRLEVQIYRTKKNQAAPFYLITTLPMSFNNTTGYLNFRDSFSDVDLSNLDEVVSALKGQELGTAWSEPLRAKYTTSVDNRLIQANLRDYPQLDLQIVADGSVDRTVYNGNTLLFRRSDIDPASTTDMLARAKYEWIDGFTGTAGTYTTGSNQFSFVTSSATGATTGDWIYLTYATVATTGRDLTYAGWWQIATVVGTTVTVNLVGAAAAASYPDSYVIATATADIPVLLGVDGNLGMVGSNDFDTFEAMRRMSLAINASMRQVDTSLASMLEFTPWIVSRSGNDVAQAGRLLVRQPRADITTPAVVPTFSGYKLFINSINRSTGVEVSATTRVFPSRLLFSYQNYPEIMDNPTATLDSQSDSTIDVNSADGQEITGVIPFFGDAAFGAAQQSAILVVFKTNSIYLVDLNEKVAGRNPLQKIDSQGIGCTAPFSIATTLNGIMFANESGMYCLRRTQNVEYLGKYMERNWEGRVDLSSLEIAQGHHFGIGRVYKLSVPLLDNRQSNGYVENSDVYVYDHTGEAASVVGSVGHGGWSRYDNHAATGWANQGDNAYFGVTYGRVFSIRNVNTPEESNTNYRDDSSPIDFQVRLRANDFGASGLRKVLDSVVVNYRNGARSATTTVSYSVDMEQEFSSTQPFIVPKEKTGSGIDDHIGVDVVPIRHSVERRRGLYFAILVQNVGIDEAIDIAGIIYNVAGLTTKGVKQAAQTTGA